MTQELFIHYIEVPPFYEKCGIGTACLDYFTSALAGQLFGYKKVILFPLNPELSEKFYKPLGFRSVVNPFKCRERASVPYECLSKDIDVVI